MRSFIAINIPERSKNLIENKIDLIKNEVNQDLKWVDKENWHLTLKFLGEINQNQIDTLKQRLISIKEKFNIFPVQFKEIDAFPNLDYPKVFFVKINRGNQKLIQLHQTVEKQMEKEGFEPEDRDYIPHLTVARSRENTNMEKLSKKYKKFDQEFFINVFMDAETLSLMKSELYPDGPVYEKIFNISLK